MTERTSHRLPPSMVAALEDAIKSARLTNASFDNIHRGEGGVTYREGTLEERTAPSMTDLIREKVRLHHSSWIIGPIQRVLEWSLSTDDGSMDEYNLEGRLQAPLPNPKVIEEARAEIEALKAEVGSLRRFKAAVIEASGELEAALRSED